MCYMMSKEAYLTDADGHNVAHLMFYIPLMTVRAGGQICPNSPVMLDSTVQRAPTNRRVHCPRGQMVGRNGRPGNVGRHDEQTENESSRTWSLKSRRR